jgi:hypothetical protein
MKNDKPSIHQIRALYLHALGIPFAGVDVPVAYLHDGCELYSSIAVNDEPSDGRA